jgi:hypothetical protein
MTGPCGDANGPARAHVNSANDITIDNLQDDPRAIDEDGVAVCVGHTSRVFNCVAIAKPQGFILACSACDYGVRVDDLA